MTRTTGLAAAAGGVAATALVLACRPWAATAQTPPPTPFAGDRAPAPAAPTPAAPPAPFAAGRDPAPAGPTPAAVDGDRALKYLRQLCDLGPRVSGSAGMARQQKLVADHFAAHGAKVARQEFDARQRSRRAPVGMVNLIASWHPERARRVILCAHYDSRPAAHEEADRGDWAKPFVGANDGTSGVALLMELAHHLSDCPTPVGVDVVLFDGEEYIFDPGVPSVREGDKYFLGSEHFAAEYDKNKAKLPYRYEAAILLDLFAHPGARLAVEGYSQQFAPRLVHQVWKTAEAVGATSFKYERGYRRTNEVQDDHLPLNYVGIPAIDIMDFDYPHWHRLADTPDKCSAKQLAEVGRVLTAWLSVVK